MRRDALESRANRGMRAYVTGSDDAQTSAMRALYTLTPHRVGELKARGTRATRRLRAARTASRRRSPGRAQGDGGRSLRFFAGATVPTVVTLRAAG